MPISENLILWIYKSPPILLKWLFTPPPPVKLFIPNFQHYFPFKPIIILITTGIVIIKLLYDSKNAYIVDLQLS